MNLSNHKGRFAPSSSWVDPNTKICPKCRTPKNVSEFCPVPGKRRVSSWCRSCIGERDKQPHEVAKRAAANKKWREQNSARISERRKKKYWADPEANKARSRAWHNAHPEATRRITLKRRGITEEQYQDLLEAQTARCALCDGDFGSGKAAGPAIDHDHRTGKVRGILHGRCNLALGQFNDDETVLLKAVEYLRRSRV